MNDTLIDGINGLNYFDFRKIRNCNCEMKEIRLKNTQCSTRSNSCFDHQIVEFEPEKKDLFMDGVKQRVHSNLHTKYSTCENFIILNEINRTISCNFIDNIEKECILKTTINDILKNKEEEKLQNFYSTAKSLSELPDLVEYYKYYSQKSVIFIKDFFELLYQYQEKRKVVEYNRLKVLLNLSDSKESQISEKIDVPQNELECNISPTARVYASRKTESKGNKRKKVHNFPSFNILDDIDFSRITSSTETEESILINRLRNNLSKHIASNGTKNMSLEQLDKCFHFLKKDESFQPIKENFERYFFKDTKAKAFKRPKEIHIEEIRCPEWSRRESNLRKRNTKRTNSCEFLEKSSFLKSSMDTYGRKLRRKKNMSMDCINIYNASPYHLNEENLQHSKQRKTKVIKHEKEDETKHKIQIFPVKGSEVLMDSICGLKSKIKKEKEKLMKEALNPKITLRNEKKITSTPYQIEKMNSSLINTANQRFTKKNYDKLREKTHNLH